MFALSLNFCEIFEKQEKCQSFYIENKGQSQGVENGTFPHSTRNVRLPIADFFRILVAWEHMFSQTGNTHAQKRSHLMAEGLFWRFA